MHLPTLKPPRHKNGLETFVSSPTTRVRFIIACGWLFATMPLGFESEAVLVTSSAARYNRQTEHAYAPVAV